MLLLGICLSGCSTASDDSRGRWCIQTIEYSGGTNYSMNFKQPMLLDNKTGRTWALTTDDTNHCYVWVQSVVKDQVGQPVTP